MNHAKAKTSLDNRVVENDVVVVVYITHGRIRVNLFAEGFFDGKRPYSGIWRRSEKRSWSWT